MAEGHEDTKTSGGTQVETLKEQGEIKDKRIATLAPYMFKKGQSGNPKGRPPGKSVKERAQAMLRSMDDEQFEEFLHGLDKRVIWEMAEGKPKQDVEHGGIVTISHVLDSLENDNGQETAGQGVEVGPSVQNQEQGTEANQVQPEQSPSPLQPEQVVTQPNPEVPPIGVHNG